MAVNLVQCKANGWPGMPGLYEGEPNWLATLARKAPAGVALEIGVRHGYSLLQWAPVRRGRGRIIGVEKLDTRIMRRCLRGLSYVDILIGDSADTPEEIPDLAFLFIDGDHKPEGIRRDIKRFVPRVLPAGIVAYHDYGRHREGPPEIGVTDAVDEWQAHVGWEFLGQVATTRAYRRPCE